MIEQCVDCGICVVPASYANNINLSFGLHTYKYIQTVAYAYTYMCMYTYTYISDRLDRCAAIPVLSLLL